MRTAFLPVHLDIDCFPQFNHPLVQAYVDPDIELDEVHIKALYDAIKYAESLIYDN